MLRAHNKPVTPSSSLSFPRHSFARHFLHRASSLRVRVSVSPLTIDASRNLRPVAIFHNNNTTRSLSTSTAKTNTPHFTSHHSTRLTTCVSLPLPSSPMCDCIGSLEVWGNSKANIIAQTPSSALPEGRPGIISSMATTKPTTFSDASTPCPDERQTPRQTAGLWRTPCLRLSTSKGLPTSKPTTLVAPRRPAHSRQDHPAACRRAHSRPPSP